MDAAKIYDKMAGVYRNISNGRWRYLNAVDDIIVLSQPRAPKRYLDVGCGDGHRTKILTNRIEPHGTDLIDPSMRMVEKASAVFNHVELCSIENYVAPYCYNLITALWNVLGHVEDREKSLSNIRSLLDPRDGLFIFDVNNRYNLGYGFWNVAKNMLRDLFRLKSGWFSFNFKGEEFPTYLYSPREIKGLLKKAGLEVVKSYGVDYETGEIHKSLFRGQMVFVTRRAG
jgi:SAM-dependent methyltransferase